MLHPVKIIQVGVRNFKMEDILRTNLRLKIDLGITFKDEVYFMHYTREGGSFV